MRTTIILSVVMVAAVCAGCGERQEAKLGSAARPIEMAMVPSVETQKLLASGEALARLLEKETGYKFRASVPTSYAAVIEAMAAGKVDVGWLSPLPYVLAHSKYGAEVILVTVRGNLTHYQSFIVVRADSGINKLEDLKGKKFAYGDPISTSGSIYPKHLIRTSGYDPERFFSSVIYAGKHDAVISAVVSRQVDGGAIYGSEVSDARELVQRTIPDVMKLTKVIARSEPIPNDTVSVRKGLPKEMVRKIRDGLIKVAQSDEGRRTVMDLYGIDGFKPAKDSDYDSVRRVARAEGITLEQFRK